MRWIKNLPQRPRYYPFGKVSTFRNDFFDLLFCIAENISITQYKKGTMFKTKARKEKALTIRITQLTLDRIKILASDYDISQSEVVETLVADHFDKYLPKKQDTQDDVHRRNQ
jgi:hypothetical protein